MRVTDADRVHAIRSNLNQPDLSAEVIIDRVRRILSDDSSINLSLTRRQPDEGWVCGLCGDTRRHTR
jgi:hypothetical protein